MTFNITFDVFFVINLYPIRKSISPFSIRKKVFEKSLKWTFFQWQKKIKSHFMKSLFTILWINLSYKCSLFFNRWVEFSCTRNLLESKMLIKLNTWVWVSHFRDDHRKCAIKPRTIACTFELNKRFYYLYNYASEWYGTREWEMQRGE